MRQFVNSAKFFLFATLLGASSSALADGDCTPGIPCLPPIVVTPGDEDEEPLPECEALGTCPTLIDYFGDLVVMFAGVSLPSDVGAKIDNYELTCQSAGTSSNAFEAANVANCSSEAGKQLGFVRRLVAGLAGRVIDLEIRRACELRVSQLVTNGNNVRPCPN